MTELGFNRYLIHNDDCLDVMESMVEHNAKVDCIITDPPYLYLNHKLDRPFDEEKFFELCSKITNKIIFFGRGDSFYKWNLLCAENGFEFKEEIVWNKKMISNPMGKLMRIHETISVRCKKNENINKVYINTIIKHINNDDMDRLIEDIKSITRFIKSETFSKYVDEGILDLKDSKSKHTVSLSKDFKEQPREYRRYKAYEKGSILSSIITENREHFKMEHPTQKPVNLLENLIKLISNENDVVFDPFMGSGTTGVACLNTNRKFIGCEIDKDYFDIASKRLKEL